MESTPMTTMTAISTSRSTEWRKLRNHLKPTQKQRKKYEGKGVGLGKTNKEESEWSNEEEKEEEEDESIDIVFDENQEI